MPTFSKIDGAEPSTVTFSLASVTQDRGGVTQHQEIVTLGGTESTLAVAAVLASAPASTAWALAVREVSPTTSVRVFQSTAGDLNVTVAGYVAPSTIVTVSTGSVRVHQSTAGDLNVTVAGYVAPSTVVTVSTGSVRVHQSTAGDLNVTVAGYVAPSTTVQVSSLGGTVAVAPASSGATLFFPVRVSDGSTYITDSTLRALRVTSVDAGGSTQVTLSRVLDSSNAAVGVADSANNALRVNVVAGSVAGDTTATVSFAAGYVSTSAPAANSSGLIVRVVDYSTTVNVSSLAGKVLVDQNSTVWVAQVSSVAGTVLISHAALTELGDVMNAGMMDVNLANGFSTTVNVSSGVIRAQAYTSSGGGVEGSTASPAHGVIGLHVRQVLSSLQSTSVLITSTHSTALYDLITSAASVRHCVYAYMVTSTHTIPSTLVFMSSNSIDRWHVGFGSGSSGITGANLSVSPPGFLFRTDAQNALRVRIEGASSVTSTVVARISLSYWTE
jgi:hypothetical protein